MQSHDRGHWFPAFCDTVLQNRHSGARRRREPAIHNHRTGGFALSCPDAALGYGFRAPRFARPRNDGGWAFWVNMQARFELEVAKMRWRV
jgi:hypothetical protein